MEEESLFTRTRQLDTRKLVNEPRRSEFPSRSRGRANEEEHTTEKSSDSRRTISRQEKTPALNTNLRQQSNNRRSKELHFRPRSELDINLRDPENDFRRSNPSRSRTKISEETNNNRIRPRYEAESTTLQTYERDALASRGASRVSGRENQIRSREEIGAVRRNTVPNERRPSLSLTSLSPEDVTFPSRGRSRQTPPPDESNSIQNKVSSRNRNTAGSSRGQTRDSLSQTRTFPSRSSVTDPSVTRELNRRRGPDTEKVGVTQPGSRVRNENPLSRSKSIAEIPKQDVESRLTGRRRTLDTAKSSTADIPNDSIRTTLLPKDEGRFTMTESQESSTAQTPLFSSIPVTSHNLEELDSSEIPESKVLETNIDPLPTASNDVLISTQLLHSTEEAEQLQGKTLVSNSKEDTLTKALHARSRGRPSETFPNDSPEASERGTSRSNFRNRQRTKTSNPESRFIPRERNLRLESEPERRARVSQRNIGTNTQSINDQNIQEIRNSFRSRNSALSRHSSASKEQTNQENNNPPQPVPIRRSGSFEVTPIASETGPQTEAIPSSKATSSQDGSKRTLPKPTVESTKLSRGRGQVKQGGGKRSENEVSK